MNRPSVMALAPGAAGREHQHRALVPLDPHDGRASEQPGGELLAVARRCGGRRGRAARAGRRTPGGRRRRPSPGRAAPSSSVGDVVVGVGPPMRASAATRRVSAVSGMRASSASASSWRRRRPGRRAARPARRPPRRGRARARAPGAATPRRRPRAASASASSSSVGQQARRRTPAPSASGWAPTKPSTTLPSFSAYTAGMPCTWNAWRRPAGSRRRRPWPARPCRSVSSTTFSRIGPSVLHGPHHSAHRSTTTGTCFGPLEDLGLEGGVGDVDRHGWQSTGGGTLAHRDAGRREDGEQ